MHKRLEDYLNQIGSQLGNLPAQQRDAEIREIRSHLEKLVADYQREGLSQDAAINKAFDQFGPSHTNGRALRKAWDRNRISGRALFLRASMITSVVLTSFLLVFATMFTLNTTVRPVNGQWSQIATVDRQHQLEVQRIQKRFQDDNFAIQHMDPHNEAAVSKAQGEAMDRVNKAMIASSNRWQASVEQYQTQALIEDVSLALVGGVILSGLLAALLIVTFRVLGGRGASSNRRLSAS